MPGYPLKKKELKQKKVTHTELLPLVRTLTHTGILVYIWVSGHHIGSNKWSQRIWRPGCTWQPVSSSPKTQQKHRDSISREARNSCACPCMLVSFSRLNPTTSPISSDPPHPPVPTPGFSFNEMFGSLHSPYSLSFQFYPFSFLQLIFCLSLLHCLWVFISHLAGKGNKRPTYWGSLALLCHFVLLHPPFCLLFLFVAADLIREMVVR